MVLKVEFPRTTLRVPRSSCNTADGENVLKQFSNDVSKTAFLSIVLRGFHKHDFSSKPNLAMTELSRALLRCHYQH